MKDNENNGLLSGPALQVRKRAVGFKSDENGSMIIFGLFIFMIMLGAGGMAVDFMRAERERAKLQYTLDRAVLASAALSNPLNEKEVVADYFRKAGYPDGVVETTPKSGLNFKTVRADAQTRMRTFFIKSFGVPELQASASGTAEERIQNVEISLVLDVSGSMGNREKLEKLKVAAKDFVTTVLEANQPREIARPQLDADGEQMVDTNGNPVMLEPGQQQRIDADGTPVYNVDGTPALLEKVDNKYVSINLIPYNMQVNVGSEVLNTFENVNYSHDYSACVDFSKEQFDTVAIKDLDHLNQAGHFDAFTKSADHPDFSEDDGQDRVFHCPTSEASKVVLRSSNISKLHAKIDSLQAGGNTSIDIGVKWGAYFLDPSSRSNITRAGNTDHFTNRPVDYNKEDNIKVLVVMTDGQNTEQKILDPDFATGPSNVWKDTASENLTIRNTDRVRVPLSNGSTYGFNYFTTSILSTKAGTDEDGETIWKRPTFPTLSNYTGYIPNFDTAEQLSWPEVWDMMSVKYFSEFMIYRQNFNVSRYYDYNKRIMASVGSVEKEARMDAVCDAAKENNVVVYTIGFEVTDHSAEQMEDCASDAANFFRVEDREISDAFNAIAKTIQRLKLIN